MDNSKLNYSISKQNQLAEIMSLPGVIGKEQTKILNYQKNEHFCINEKVNGKDIAFPKRSFSKNSKSKSIRIRSVDAQDSTTTINLPDIEC